MTEITEDTRYTFRFPTREARQQFKIASATLNKSMNQLLGEIVDDFFM